MPARRVTSVTVTKLLLDVLFWVSGIAAVLFTLFLVLSPLAMHDGFVADAAFPVSIGEGTVRTILPLTVDTVASPGVQRAVIVDARGELRLQTTRWPLQFLPNLGMLLALWLAIYIIYLMRGILRRVKDGDPFAAQNVRSLQIIGTLLLALGLFGPVLEYAIVRSLLTHIAGLVATGHHPSPVPHADVVTTTTHKTLRGPRAGLILCREEMAKKLNSSIFPGTQGGPLMHVIAAKAVAFKEAMTPEWREYQARIVRNAKALAAAVTKRGFRLVSGGTDNHLMLVDLKETPLTGKDAQEALDRVMITVNKNTIPFETRSPFITSGIRFGTPGITTRGMGEKEMERIGNIIADVLSAPGDAQTEKRVAAEVRDLCESFPLYPERIAAYGGR